LSVRVIELESKGVVLCQEDRGRMRMTAILCMQSLLRLRRNSERQTVRCLYSTCTDSAALREAAELVRSASVTAWEYSIGFSV
jgi:hypothetical protein